MAYETTVADQPISNNCCCLSSSSSSSSSTSTNTLSQTTNTSATSSNRSSKRPSTSTKTKTISRSPSSSNTDHQYQPSNELPHDIFTISDESLSDQYTFETEVGYGNWGSIWRVSKNPDAGSSSASEMAIKLVHRDKSSSTTAAKIKSLWSEFKILRQFKNNSHPNVLSVSSFVITPSYALLTMAYHPKNLPIRLLENSPKTFKILRGCCAGLRFLHTHGVSHNDIKPANIVLSSMGEPVIIDFGFSVGYGFDFATRTAEKKPFWSSLSWGTPEYLSPQRAKGEWHDERLSDIWSLGITIYEIVVGRTPFEADDKEEFLTKAALEVYYQRTLKGEFLGQHSLSRELRDLIKKMLQPQPEERIQSCDLILTHPFFKRKNPIVQQQLSIFEARTNSLKQIGGNGSARISKKAQNEENGTKCSSIGRRIKQLGLDDIQSENDQTPKRKKPPYLSEKSINTPSKSNSNKQEDWNNRSPSFNTMTRSCSKPVLIKAADPLITSCKRIPVPKFDSTKFNSSPSLIKKNQVTVGGVGARESRLSNRKSGNLKVGRSDCNLR